MANYPYTLKTSTLEDFMKKITPRPEPKKVTQSYLKSLGYTSSHDFQIIPILKFINFLESNGSPNAFFKSFRDTRKSKATMAQVLKESYADLFELDSNPCQADDQVLENFFRTATGRGGRMLRATVGTFKVLCKFADFKAEPPKIKTGAEEAGEGEKGRGAAQMPTGVTINLNIQLTLPATEDAKVYDNIFKALKDNLLSQD